MKDIIKWSEMRHDVDNLTLEEKEEQLHYIKAETKGGKLFWGYTFDPSQTPLMLLNWMRETHIKPEMLFYADIFLSRRSRGGKTDPHIATVEITDKGVVIREVTNSKINPYRKRHRSKIMQAIFGQ